MMMSVKFEGAKPAQRCRRYGKRTVAAMDKALHDFAKQVGVGARFYVPVDTGALRRSMRIDHGRGWASVTFGDMSATPPVYYAVYVHEGLGNSGLHKAPTRKKFLQEAIDLAVNSWRGIVNSRMAKVAI